MIQAATTPAIDEVVQQHAALEWWFAHGRYAGPGIDERYFMLSLFRFKIPDIDEQPIDAFAALLSVLDPASGTQQVSTVVDPRVLAALQRPEAARSVDCFSPDAVLEELKACGLPREFECPEAAPEFSVFPFRVEWRGIVLAVENGAVGLRFPEPETGRVVDVQLLPESPRMIVEATAAFGEPDESIHYATYPDMRLTGSAGGADIAGEAWFDHQWGGRAMLQDSAQPPRPRGWDWLGFRLDDGSQGIVLNHWDTEAHRELGRYLTLRDAAGVVSTWHEIDWEPVRWWSSPATRIRYPVEWRLTSADCDVDLFFTPFADNQEIRVFGPQRAIWEGAGRVRGKHRGSPVAGDARLELQGLGYIGSLTDYLRGWAEPVDASLAAFLPKDMGDRDVRRFAGPPEWIYEPISYTRMLSQPIWDLLSRDGKRWRAIFSYLLMEAMGRDAEPLSDVAFILPEMLHNASLIIDDIQDDALLRRGAETIHRRYGVDVAISAANTAYFLPLLVVLDHAVLTHQEKQGISEIYQRVLVRAHLGQSLDLFWSHSLNEAQLETWMADSIGPKIMQMYALKTAAPLEGLSDIASLLAGVSEPARTSAMRFARALGLAFQLVDDVNNFSSSPSWGKQRGEDLRTGKLTYVVLTALRRLPHPERALLGQILCRPELRADAASLQTGIELVLRSCACEQVRDEARAMLVSPWEALSRHIPASVAKTELRMLWAGLLGAPHASAELPQ